MNLPGRRKMVTAYPYSEKRSVYPGEFIPKVRTEDIAGELNKQHKMPVTEPLINVTEFAECFKVEVAVPGVSRDDFFINTDNNILSITVFHKEHPEKEKGSFQLHEFDCDCFHRHIILPENVDAEFVVAEYRAGVLHMYLPKTDHPLKQAPARIVVY
jgi:HSP20 family protein